MATLKTNYVDDILNAEVNQQRKYQMITNDDGTVSFVDVTNYTSVGTNFGAKDINDTNKEVNALNESLQTKTINVTVTGASNSSVKCHIIGNIVIVDGFITPSNATITLNGLPKNASGKILQIPLISVSSYNAIANFSDGAVAIQKDGLTVNDTYVFNFSYVTN